MKRSMVVLCGALSLTGCLDMGLEGNQPLAEAQQAPVSELVAAVTAPMAELAEVRLIVDGRLWVSSGVPWTPQLERLRPIGSAAGRTVFARSWDDAPYDELFTRVESPADDPLALDPEADRWQAYVHVIGGGGRGAAAPAAH